MPVTAGQRDVELSQREQYAKGGVGRKYWDHRDRVTFRYLTGPRILDAGCGEGITLEKLIRAFPDAEVRGLDVDPANVAICRRHDLPARQGSVYELPFDDGAFDSCLLMEVIEHLERPRQALAELARVTRPGGRVLVVYPVDWAMFAARVICGRFKEAAFDPAHLRRWSARALRREMRQAGLRPIATRSMPLLWPLKLHGLVVGAKQ